MAEQILMPRVDHRLHCGDERAERRLIGCEIPVAVGDEGIDEGGGLLAGTRRPTAGIGVAGAGVDPDDRLTERDGHLRLG